MDYKKPTVKGLKNGKTYKIGKTIRYNCTDSSGILFGKDENLSVSVFLNGKYYIPGNPKGSFKLKKKGNYKFVVEDNFNNKTVIKFKVK